jgi:hypothetical protein
MAKVRQPRRFSDFFTIDKAIFRSRGAFDPILNADTRLFIDVLLLEKSRHDEMRAAHAVWIDHFKKIVKLLRVAKNPKDPPWIAAGNLLRAKEFKGTCLGYGSGTIAGSGIGPELRDQVLHTAHRVIELGREDPEMFTLMPVLEENFGPDRISDLTTRIISPQLARYTTHVLEGIPIERREFQFGDDIFSLPTNPLAVDSNDAPIPVVLVPKDVLSVLPFAANWKEIARVAGFNVEYRGKVNKRLGSLWRNEQTFTAKKEFKEYALAHKEVVERLLDILARTTKAAYNLDTDPQGRVRWLEDGAQLAKDFPLALSLTNRSPEEVGKIVETIILHYKELVEHNGIWKSFYGAGNKQLHERYPQQVFFVAADVHCRANRLDLTPEANQGGGPVDFKFSEGYDSRAVVELKYSNNNRLEHGYKTQLEAYKKAQKTRQGFFVVLDVGAGTKQVNKVLAMAKRAAQEGTLHSKVIVIDARIRASASKL